MNYKSLFIACLFALWGALAQADLPDVLYVRMHYVRSSETLTIQRTMHLSAPLQIEEEPLFPAFLVQTLDGSSNVLEEVWVSSPLGVRIPPDDEGNLPQESTVAVDQGAFTAMFSASGKEASIRVYEVIDQEQSEPELIGVVSLP